MRAFFLAVATLAVGCGLTFSPGDYGGEATPTKSLTPEGGTPSTLPDGGMIVPPTDDGGPPTTPLHLVVMAGENDKGAAASDVWTAPIDTNGDVGAFSYLQSAPLAAPIVTGTLLGGRSLYVAVRGPTGRVVESLDFTIGGWTSMTVASPSLDANSFGQFFDDSSLVAVGGSSTTTGDDGFGNPTTSTSYSKQLAFARLSGTMYTDPTPSTATLPAGIANVLVTRYKGFVYFAGTSDAVDYSHIYVGKLGLLPGTPGASDVVETNQLVDPATKKAYIPTTPSACAGEGHIFVVGGADSDMVVFADIDETTGLLGPWKVGAILPTKGIVGAGCAVWNGALHLIGGTVKAVRSNQILRSRFGADGTMAPWELSSGQNLLAPRSNILALTY